MKEQIYQAQTIERIQDILNFLYELEQVHFNTLVGGENYFGLEPHKIVGEILKNSSDIMLAEEVLNKFKSNE